MFTLFESSVLPLPLVVLFLPMLGMAVGLWCIFIYPCVCVECIHFKSNSKNNEQFLRTLHKLSRQFERFSGRLVDYTCTRGCMYTLLITHSDSGASLGISKTTVYWVYNAESKFIICERVGDVSLITNLPVPVPYVVFLNFSNISSHM